MASLAPLLDLLPDERVRALVGSHAPITVPDAARPYLLAALARHLDKPVLAITARAEEAESVARDIQAFLGREGADVFPGWEVLPGEPVSPSVETMGRRLQVLHKLRAAGPSSRLPRPREPPSSLLRSETISCPSPWLQARRCLSRT